MKAQQYVHLSTDVEYVSFSSSTQFAVFPSDPSVHGSTAAVVEEAGLGGMKHVVTLHHSPLLLLVASGDKPGTSPRKLKIWNSQTRSTLHEITFKSTIEALQWNKKYIIVMLDSELHILDLQSMQIRMILPCFPKCFTFALGSSPSSASSSAAMPSMSSNQSVTSMQSQHTSLSGFGNTWQQSLHAPSLSVSSESFLIYPTADMAGSVDIYDIHEHKLLHKIQAHRTALQLLAMNTHNNLLATSSKTGTIIRVFAIPSGEILFSYRISHLSITIQQLVFCPHSDYLLVTTTNAAISLCPLFTIKSKPLNASSPATNNAKELSGKHAMKMIQQLAHQISSTAAATLSQKSQDDNNAAIDISHLSVTEAEDEDGFCTIEKTEQVTEERSDRSTSKEPEEDHEDNQGLEEDDNNVNVDDDNISVLTTPTIISTQPPSQQTTSTLNTSSYSTTANSNNPSVFQQLWSNVTNTQTLFDASLNSIQKIRSYSQEVFASSSSNQGNPTQVHFEIDKEIRRPVVQANLFTTSELEQHHGVVFALTYRPKRLTYYHAQEAEDDIDDLNSAFGDLPTIQHQVQSHTNEEELKVIMITKLGLFRRFDLSSFQFGYKGPGGHSRGSQSPHTYYQSPQSSPSTVLETKDILALVEDERTYFST